ncbi:hypothetical protein A2U01_0066101, partial [Trifolium medium]|nr:hypothetical protein [Trifolium medium]
YRVIEVASAAFDCDFMRKLLVTPEQVLLREETFLSLTKPLRF